MAWSPEVPPPPVRPVVTGWFAIFNVVSLQTMSMTTLGNVIGMMAALQTAPISNAAASKGVQKALQSMSVTNAGQVSAPRTAAQTFSITDSALLRGALIAAQSLTLTQLATVVAVGNALQSVPITNAAVAKGLQTAAQSLAIADAAQLAGKPSTIETFTVIDGATVLGKPGANDTMTVSGAGTVVGVALSAQQVSLLNVGNITGFEGALNGAQVIPMLDGAAVKGIQTAGQSFTIVNGAVLRGATNAGQIMALTQSGAAKGIRAADTSFVVTDAGTVYAVVTGASSMSMTNAATAVDATPSVASIIFDNSALDTAQSGNAGASGSVIRTVNLTHSAAAFGIVVINYGVTVNAMQTPARGGVIPTVKIGSVELDYLGSVDNGNSDSGGHAIFAADLTTLGAATDTVHVTFPLIGSQAGKLFTGQVSAYSYLNVKNVIFNNVSGNSTAASLTAATSSLEGRRVFGVVSGYNPTLSAFSLTTRRTGGDWIAGDLAATGTTQAVSATRSPSGAWAVSTLDLSPVVVPVVYSAITPALTFGGTNGTSGTITTTALSEMVYLFGNPSGGQITTPTLDGVAMDFVGNFAPLAGLEEFDVFSAVARTAGVHTVAFTTSPTNAWGQAWAMSVKNGYPMYSSEIQSASALGTTATLAAVMDGAEILLHAMVDFSGQINSTSGGTNRGINNTNAAQGNIAIATSPSAVTFTENLGAGSSNWRSMALPVGKTRPSPKVRHRATGISIVTVDSKTTTGTMYLWTRPGDYLIVDIMGDDAGTALSHDGVALPLLASFQSGTNSANQQLTSFQRFGGFVGPLNGGLKALAWTGSSPVGACRLNATVYSGVVGVGATTHAFGSGGTPSISGTCIAGEMLVAGFGANQSQAAWTPSGGRIRYCPPVTAMPMAMMDSPSSATFSVTDPAIGSWNAFVTVLKGKVPGFTGATDGGRDNNHNVPTALGWTQVVTEADSDIFVAVLNQNGFGTTARINGANMTEVASIGLNNSNVNGMLRLYRATDLAPGSYSMNAGASGANFMNTAAVSAVFPGVGSIGTPVTVFGTGGALSQAVTVALGQRVIQVFGYKPNAAVAAITPTSGGTNRVAQSTVGTGFNIALSLGEATASDTFIASGAGASQVWGGIALPLNP